MHNAEWTLVVNIAVGWALTFVLGFEREVRGAPAGDRTFSLIGLSTALIGTVAPHYPAVLGGAVTGIGFIGGGLCFRQAVKQAEQEREILHGVTTAASIFGAAAIGAIAGCGDLLVAAMSTVGVLLSLEIRHIPILRYLDARRWSHLFADDNHRHFTLREIEHSLEHSLAHPHQEFAAIAHRVHEAGSAEAAHQAGSAAAAAAAGAGGKEPADEASAEVVEEPTLVVEAEEAAILANQVIASGAARGGR